MTWRATSVRPYYVSHVNPWHPMTWRAISISVRPYYVDDHSMAEGLDLHLSDVPATLVTATEVRPAQFNLEIRSTRPLTFGRFSDVCYDEHADFQRLKSKHHQLLSTLAFNSHSRRYSEDCILNTTALYANINLFPKDLTQVSIVVGRSRFQRWNPCGKRLAGIKRLQ